MGDTSGPAGNATGVKLGLSPGPCDCSYIITGIVVPVTTKAGRQEEKFYIVLYSESQQAGMEGGYSPKRCLSLAPSQQAL